MSQRPEVQQQPPYPRQYPPLNYGPPYFESYPPPKRDDKKIMTIIIIVIIVVLVLPTVLAAVLYFVVIGLAPSGTMVPTGVWGPPTPLSNTQYNVEFGRINPEPRPMDIVVILVRNGTVQGVYEFSGNNDGALTLDRGTYVGTLTYADLADNQRINVGDYLKLTDLHPSSDYQIRMIWGPTGDQITSTTFSTPA